MASGRLSAGPDFRSGSFLRGGLQHPCPMSYFLSTVKLSPTRRKETPAIAREKSFNLLTVRPRQQISRYNHAIDEHCAHKPGVIVSTGRRRFPTVCNAGRCKHCRRCPRFQRPANGTLLMSVIYDICQTIRRTVLAVTTRLRDPQSFTTDCCSICSVCN